MYKTFPTFPTHLGSIQVSQSEVGHRQFVADVQGGCRHHDGVVQVTRLVQDVGQTDQRGVLNLAWGMGQGQPQAVHGSNRVAFHPPVEGGHVGQHPGGGLLQVSQG